MKKQQNKKKKNNNQPRLVGKGDYNLTTNEYQSLVSKLDKIDGKIPSIKGLASNAGAALGGLVGKPAIGRALAEKASSLFGFGDYTITANSLMKNYTSTGVIPKFHSASNGVRIREREYIGDVVSSPTPGAFKNKSYPITPTDSVTFPWLSNIAKLYDQWEPNGIVFEFVSTSSDFNGSAQALGSVILATDYDCLDEPYPNKVVMDNADYSCSSKPSINQVHGVECDPDQRTYKLMFTKSLTTPAANRNTLGNFQVASTGVSASGVVLGELWVSYDFTFYKKQILGDNTPNYNITGNYTAGGTYSSIAIPVNLSGWTYTIPSTALNQMYTKFPPNIVSGRYLIQVFWTVPVGIAGNLMIIPTFGLTTITNRFSGAEVGKGVMSTIVCDVTAGNAEFMISSAGATASFTLSVTAVPLMFTF